jgi:hypothetical protein
VLHQQHVQLPGSFTVPNQTTVPAYQLVGLFRNFLGWPNLPQAAKTSSLEAKWRLLQLTLLHAAQQEQRFQLQLQQLTDGVLLPQAQQKLAKVRSYESSMVVTCALCAAVLSCRCICMHIRLPGKGCVVQAWHTAGEPLPASYSIHDIVRNAEQPCPQEVMHMVVHARSACCCCCCCCYCCCNRRACSWVSVLC